MSNPSNRQRLSDAAHNFCGDFARKESIDVLVSYFSDTRSCEVIEHGLSRFAPFIGKSFTGRDGMRQYFSTVTALISYDDMDFTDYIVDPVVRKVSVKATAKFTWITTNESWGETFTYMLEFDEAEKITRYEIWGDTGALYLASHGRLKQVSRSTPKSGVIGTPSKYRRSISIIYLIQIE
ncbi:transcription elongation factor S-II [Chiua virens]|nr:transcription elongation factor S-II [Chiua virens]